MRKVVGMGETILDILFHGKQPVAAVHGGSCFNSVISVGRAGVPCAFVGYTGGDIVGDQTIEFMQQNGVGTDYFEQHADEKSAISLAFLNENGDASYVFHKGVPQLGNEWNLPTMHADDVLLFGSYYAACQGMRPLVTAMLDLAKNAGSIIYYDLNFRRSHSHELEALMPTIQKNFLQSSVVRGSADDFEVMYGLRDAAQVYERYIKKYCEVFICTAGASQVTVCTPNGVFVFEAPLVDNVVSTVGAGDNFNAGFSCALIRYGITGSQLAGLGKDMWTLLVADACSFAGCACQSTDNYVTVEFGQEYHKKMML